MLILDHKERLGADQKEKKDKLKKDFENGKITKQELEREMDRMAQQAENMKDLQELAELLGQCKGCLGKGGAAVGTQLDRPERPRGEVLEQPRRIGERREDRFGHPIVDMRHERSALCVGKRTVIPRRHAIGDPALLD